MATAADRLANNLNFGALGKATELRQRLLFTLGALIVFRLGTFLPIPLVFIIPDYQLQYFNSEAAEFSTGVDMAHWQQHYNLTFLKPFNDHWTVLFQNNWRKLPDEISQQQDKDNWRYQYSLITSYQF